MPPTREGRGDRGGGVGTSQAKTFTEQAGLTAVCSWMAQSDAIAPVAKDSRLLSLQTATGMVLQWCSWAMPMFAGVVTFRAREGALQT